jgi:hypothetical protein
MRILSQKERDRCAQILIIILVVYGMYVGYTSSTSQLLVTIPTIETRDITTNNISNKTYNLNEFTNFSNVVSTEDDLVRTVSTKDIERNEGLGIAAINQLNATTIIWEGVDGILKPMNQYWKGKLLCEIKHIRATKSSGTLPIIVNITFSCHDLYHNSTIGTGNFIGLLYAIRLIARIYGDVYVSYTCTDADVTKKDLILPWLMGWFPGRPMKENNTIPFSVNSMCGQFSLPPLSYMYKEIQYDLRKMAIGLLGIPSSDHPSALFAENNLWSQTSRSTKIPSLGISLLPIPTPNDSPLYTRDEYELDDTVIHFRCGDVMDSDHPMFFFLKFSGYTRYISHETSSIGVITQPFEVGTQTRKVDSDQYKLDRCRIVVHSLEQYIKERYPNARVQIRNNVNETIALTCARMIMANQTIVGVSSFNIMPAISTFGTSYMHLPRSNHTSQVSWLSNPRIDTLINNVILFDDPNVISARNMKQLWKNDGEIGVLNWFWNDSIV